MEVSDEESDSTVSDFSSFDSIKDCEYIPREFSSESSSDSENEVSVACYVLIKCGLLRFIANFS